MYGVYLDSLAGHDSRGALAGSTRGAPRSRGPERSAIIGVFWSEFHSLLMAESGGIPFVENHMMLLKRRIEVHLFFRRRRPHFE